MVLNGVIHSVDSVLTPSDVSISEYLGTHETQFADLYAALVLEGLENALECKRKKKREVYYIYGSVQLRFLHLAFFFQLEHLPFLPHKTLPLLRFWPICQALQLMTHISKVGLTLTQRNILKHNSISIYFDNTSVLTLYKFEFLTEILTYHVVPGVWFSSGLTDGMSLPTLAGSNITISLQGSGNECFRRGK